MRDRSLDTPFVMSLLMAVGTGLAVLLTVLPAPSEESRVGADVAERVGEELESRRFGTGAEGIRGRWDVFAASAHAVPVVISKEGSGSGVVVNMDPATSTGLIITNHHVIAPPFRDKEGREFVMLVFYEPQLAREPFDNVRVADCLKSPSGSSWCEMFRRVVRLGLVVRSDPDRDLGVVVVGDLPTGVRPIPFANLDQVRPGDEVMVIGHPLNLVWSLTSGIVSAVRSEFRITQSSRGITVVQTQTPIHPGNSGGPLLTAEGQLVGVMFSSHLLPTMQGTRDNPRVPAAGLNFAVAVTEVRDLIATLR